jgi:hypothetical protein
MSDSTIAESRNPATKKNLLYGANVIGMNDFLWILKSNKSLYKTAYADKIETSKTIPGNTQISYGILSNE